MIQRAETNLKKPIPEPKPIPKKEYKAMVKKEDPKETKVEKEILGVILLGVLAFSLLLRR